MNYKYVFFKYLYNKLGLNKLDEMLLNENIKMIDEENVNKRISKYFSLLNEGDIEEFNEIEKHFYQKYFSQDMEVIEQENISDEVIEFIKKTYQKFFHLNDDFTYKYYGPKDDIFMAPSDCIVIGLNYSKFDLDTNDYDMELQRQERIVVKILNYIQNEVARKNNLKLAALSFNEITLSQPFMKI